MPVLRKRDIGMLLEIVFLQVRLSDEKLIAMIAFEIVLLRGSGQFE